MALAALAGCAVLLLRDRTTAATSDRCASQETAGDADQGPHAQSAHTGRTAGSLPVRQLVLALEQATGVRARCSALSRLAQSSQLDDSAIERIASYAGAKHGLELRGCAVNALGQVKSAGTLPWLIQLIDEPAQLMAEQAVRVLALRDEREAREVVVALQDDERRSLAVVGALALAEAGAAEAASMIVKLLESPSVQDRDRLIYALGATHDPRVLALLQGYVQNGPRQAQYMAIAALGDLGGASAARTLLSLMTERPELSQVVASALARSGDSDARTALLSCAESNENQNTMTAALQALTELEGPDVQAVMTRALSSSSPQAAGVAMDYFAGHADFSAVPALSALARAGSARNSWMAVTALSRIGGDEARGVLEELARSGTRQSEAALTALGSLPGGSESARTIALERARIGGPLLPGALELLANDDSAEARAMVNAAAHSKNPLASTRALMLLGQRGDAESQKTLAEVLSKGGSPEQQQAAMYALAQSGGEGAAKSLRAVLDGSDSGMRTQAISALAQLGGAEAERAILSASADKDPQVMSAAAGALAQLGSPAALTRLEQVVKSANADVSRQALQLLASSAPGRADPLAEALFGSRDPEARMNALSAAGALSSPLASRIVLAGLHDSDPRVVGEALNGIGSYLVDVEAANAALLELTKNKQLPEDLQQRASALLSGGGEPDSLHPMQELSSID